MSDSSGVANSVLALVYDILWRKMPESDAPAECSVVAGPTNDRGVFHCVVFGLGLCQQLRVPSHGVTEGRSEQKQKQTKN